MSLTSLFFFVIFVVGCFATLFRSPFYGVLVYEFVYFLNPTSRWWYSGLPDLRYSYVIVVCILISFFLNRKSFKGNRFADAPQFKWLLLLGVLVLSSTLWAVSPVSHQIEAMRFFKLVVFAVLAFKILDSQQKIKIALYVYLGGIFYVSWYGWQVGRSGGVRLEGIGGPDTFDANGSAAIVVTAVPLLVFNVLYQKSGVLRCLSLIVLAFVGNCLVLLNSRGAFIALIFSMAYFGFFIFKEKIDLAVKVKFLAGILGGICLLIYLADEAFWERMLTLTNMDPEKGGGHRYLFWMKSFDMLADHPLGAGGGGYQFLSPQYLSTEFLTGGTRAVHSTWFQVLTNYGYQGFFAFVGFVASSFLFSWKVRKIIRGVEDVQNSVQAIALEASFCALLTACSFISLFAGELVYWLPFYMGAFGLTILTSNGLTYRGKIVG